MIMRLRLMTKYNNKKTIIYDITFDSKNKALYYKRVW